MDRYDAILEHLKKAQSRGLDAVTTRLKAAAENLEELLVEAKSAIQDATPRSAAEYLPIAEIESLVAKLRSQATRPQGISYGLLRTLDSAGSQSELLRSMLPVLADHVGRAVVLVIRDTEVTAWSGIGFDDGEKLRNWQGEVSASAALKRLIETTKPLSFDPNQDRLLAQWLAGEATPSEAVLVPVFLRGKLMGALYVDHQEDEPWDIDAAQALLALSCLLIDTLPYRPEGTTPMLADVVEFDVGTVSETVADEPTPAAPEPEPEAIEFEPSEPAADEPDFEAPPPHEVAEIDEAAGVDEAGGFEAAPAGEQEFELEAEPEGDAEPEFDPSATMRVDVSDMVGGPAAPTEPEESFAPPTAEALATPEAPPETEEALPPPAVQPVQPPEEIAAPEFEVGEGLARSPEDEARHEEARRFARLLVSEIKLYNEDEVERGRAEKDLGERLKEDIERSREMYEKRIPGEIRNEHDYFQDELVRILGDGDGSVLGM